MEKEPQFIKEFSKEESPNERQQTAKAIKAKRGEHFAEKGIQTERQIELQQKTVEREQELAEKLHVVGELEKQIDELSTSGLGKILNYFELRKLRADLEGKQWTSKKLGERQGEERVEQEAISGKLASKESPAEFQQAKEMLADFYKGQKEKWAKSEYTKEDITKYFSEEHLASLSIGDYAFLLKRFPGEMVAHITRQGIRDHTAVAGMHTVGDSKYQDGFMKIVEDGRLRSLLSVYLVGGEKEKAIAQFIRRSFIVGSFMDKEGNLDKERLLAALGDVNNQNFPGSYADRRAIHFATEKVADEFYGAEKGNEIFIAYPSAYIASQYYFNGQLGENSGGAWNDQWVWASEERGIGINAGIVFIPEEAKVDRKTGSLYELDSDKKPVENKEYNEAFRRVVDSDGFHSFFEQVAKTTGKFNRPYTADLESEDQELSQKMEPFRQKLEQEFGITDRRLQSAILDHSNLLGINVCKTDELKGREIPDRSVDSTIGMILKRESLLYSRSKDTISSKEFWEAYFAKNPAKRPTKIVYYKGGDPTAALMQWKEEQGINKKTKDKNIGFPERSIKKEHPQAIAGMDRFKNLLEKVIEDNFLEEESVAA